MLFSKVQNLQDQKLYFIDASFGFKVSQASHTRASGGFSRVHVSQFHMADPSRSFTAVYLKDPDSGLLRDEEQRLALELSLADMEDELAPEQQDFLLHLAS
uniref:Uncharacterized protein n=1 Tax=Opuntia streptacantha TaxID=393608 RepID=A0A7C9F2D9_OPUST